MTVILIGGSAALPNSIEGIRMYMGQWHSEKLATGDIWLSAVGQIFFSIGIGMGYFTSYASYNSRFSNAVQDTLIIAFSLNWLYTSGDGSLQSTHPIRRSAYTAFAFFTLHLPLSASFLIGGHICAVSTNHPELEEGQTRLMGGGLGVGMFCLWIMALLHRSEDESRELVLHKQARVIMRLIAAIILIAISQPVYGLSTTSLLVIEMAVIVWVVLWETVGGMSRHFQVFERWDDRNPPEVSEASASGFEKGQMS